MLNDPRIKLQALREQRKDEEAKALEDIRLRYERAEKELRSAARIHTRRRRKETLYRFVMDSLDQLEKVVPPDNHNQWHSAKKKILPVPYAGPIETKISAGSWQVGYPGKYDRPRNWVKIEISDDFYADDAPWDTFDMIETYVDEIDLLETLSMLREKVSNGYLPPIGKLGRAVKNQRRRRR